MTRCSSARLVLETANEHGLFPSVGSFQLHRRSVLSDLNFDLPSFSYAMFSSCDSESSSANGAELLLLGTVAAEETSLELLACACCT